MGKTETKDDQGFYLDEEVSTLEYALRRWWPLVYVPVNRRGWQMLVRPIHWSRPRRYDFPMNWKTHYGWDKPVCRCWCFGPFQVNRLYSR